VKKFTFGRRRAHALPLCAPGRRSFFAFLLCLAPWAAEADDGETIIVTATRTPTPQDQLGQSVTVIDAVAIEAGQLRSLPDVLADVPGLNVVQTGALGGQTSVFIRGAKSQHTKVLLDGIDMADPSTPNNTADIGKLLTGDVAGVEVLRGPGSALYGSDAIGGVINVITAGGEGPLRFTASAEGGSFDRFSQLVTASGSQGGLHYALSLDNVHEGDVMVTPLRLTPPGQARTGDFYDGVQASAKLGYDVADNLDVGAVFHYNGGLGKVTNDAFNFGTFFYGPSANRTRNATLQYATRAFVHLVLWNGRFDQTLGLAYSKANTSSADPDNGYVLARGDRVKLDWQGNLKITDGQMLVLGAETARDALHPGIFFGFPSSLSAGTTTNAGFAELESDFGSGLFSSISLRYDDNSRFGGRLTWHAAPSWTIEASGTRLKASFGTGFKAPALQQLYGAFGGNPLLKPETSTGYDAGIEQSLVGGTVQAGVTGFRNEISNLINNVFSAGTFSNLNIGKARTQGVESFLAWKASPTLSLRADYTYTDAIDAVVHVPLARVPHHKLGASVNWQVMPDLSLVAMLQFIGPQADVDREFGTPVRLDAFTLVNVAAGYRLDDHWTLFGRVENAADEQHESPYGFLRPGIGAFAGIKAGF
jgi:vitamin B12 transporter